MNLHLTGRSISADELSRLHDAARAVARHQRDAAIDDFWRGAGSLLWAQLSNARRASTRLAHRLQHHRQRRAAASACIDAALAAEGQHRA